MHHILTIKEQLTTASLGAIRNRLVDEVAKAGIGLDKLRAYALRVCSSEFIDNAIKHACGACNGDGAELLIEGDVDRERGRLRITVTDPGTVVPVMSSTIDDPDATGGRGLVVAAGYADDIGWHQRLNTLGQPTGWSVWFELDVDLEVFGQATAVAAEVQPSAAAQLSERRLKVISGLARRGLARLHWPTRRQRDSTAA
ncbi:ATP-binding protein [Kitasatospora sp. Ki12]